MTYNYKSGVIFDLDGVLIDSSRVMKAAFAYAYNDFFPGEEAPFDEFKTHMGKGFSSIMNAMKLPSEMHALFEEKSIELSNKIKVFDGVYETLIELKEARYYIGIATGKDSFRTSKILKEKNISHYFDKVVSSDQVKNGKPHPDSIYDHIKYSGLKESQIIYIGDSVADIQCAKKAGVTSVAVTWGMGERNLLIEECPDYVINDFSELRKLIMFREEIPER